MRSVKSATVQILQECTIELSQHAISHVVLKDLAPGAKVWSGLSGKQVALHLGHQKYVIFARWICCDDIAPRV